MASENRLLNLLQCGGDSQTIYTDTNLSEYVGKYISIEGRQSCYLVSENVCESVRVTFTYSGTDYNVVVPITGNQNGKNYYALGEGIGEFTEITIFWGNTPANPSGYGWRVNIELNNDFSINLFNSSDNCPFSDTWETYSDGSEFEVDYLRVIPVQPVQDIEFISCYASCEECGKDSYLLIDCSGGFELLSDDSALEQVVEDNKIIKIPYYDNKCFTVTKIPHRRGEVHIPVIEYSYSYDNCFDCYQKETIEPTVQLGTCDPQKVIDIKCDFAEMMYQQMMSRRLGIEFCCPIQKDKSTLKHDIISFQLLSDEEPPLPEPIIEECCIPSEVDCCNKGVKTYRGVTTIIPGTGIEAIRVTYVLDGVTTVVDVPKVGVVNGENLYVQGQLFENNFNITIGVDVDFEFFILPIKIAGQITIYSTPNLESGVWTYEDGIEFDVPPTTEFITIETGCIDALLNEFPARIIQTDENYYYYSDDTNYSIIFLDGGVWNAALYSHGSNTLIYSATTPDPTPYSTNWDGIEGLTTKECDSSIADTTVTTREFYKTVLKLKENSFDKDCRCMASIPSPHDCHIYSVAIIDENLTEATGNINTFHNGKVFLGYFPCKTNLPTFEVYEKSATETFCILGIPTLGYYKNNQFVSLPTTRGIECEEQIEEQDNNCPTNSINTCCNG